MIIDQNRVSSTVKLSITKILSQRKSMWKDLKTVVICTHQREADSKAPQHTTHSSALRKLKMLMCLQIITTREGKSHLRAKRHTTQNLSHTLLKRHGSKEIAVLTVEKVATAVILLSEEDGLKAKATTKQ